MKILKTMRRSELLPFYDSCYGQKQILTAEECPAAPRVQSTKERSGDEEEDEEKEEKTSRTSPSITGTWVAVSP